MKHRTKKRPKPKIVRTCHYDCANGTVMAVLMIFPVIVQTAINLIMLPIGGRGERFTDVIIRVILRLVSRQDLRCPIQLLYDVTCLK